MDIDISGLAAKLAESPKKLAIAFLAAAFLGATWFVLVRAVLIDANGPHFHANFALYVYGEQEMFEEGIFYEEVAACGGSADDPKARVHLHDYIGDVVHVHDASATWGNFFENLGFVLGNNLLFARAESYVSGGGGTLSFVLNGEPVQSVAGKTITSEDTLLISYGNEDSSVLMERYSMIEQNAAEYNEKADPAACSGSQSVGILDRIKLVLGID